MPTGKKPSEQCEYEVTVEAEIPPWLWQEVCEEVIWVAQNGEGKSTDVEEYLLNRITFDIEWRVSEE
jgi:hypothetical protein